MFTLDDLQKMVGSLDSKEAQVDVEPLGKLSLSPNTPVLKTVQSASQLKLEGKYLLQIFKIFEFYYLQRNSHLLLDMIKHLYCGFTRNIPFPNQMISNFMQFWGRGKLAKYQVDIQISLMPTLRNSGATTSFLLS